MSVAPDRFDVTIVPFPFVDRDAHRRRPAVVLSNATFNRATGMAILAMITSARDSDWHDDQIVEDIATAGLRSACKVRMKLFSLDLDRIAAPVGRLAASDRARVEAALRRTFA